MRNVEVFFSGCESENIYVFSYIYNSMEKIKSCKSHSVLHLSPQCTCTCYYFVSFHKKQLWVMFSGLLGSTKINNLVKFLFKCLSSMFFYFLQILGFQSLFAL